VPEVALQIRELQSDSSRASCFALHKYDAAFAFFFRDSIHEEHSLPAFYLGRHRKQAAMRAHGIRHRDVAEGPVVRSAAVHTHGNAQREALATAAFLLHLCLGLFRSHGAKVAPGVVSVNSTVPQVQPAGCTASNHLASWSGHRSNPVDLTLTHREC
jgi:hypothetical protein